MLAVTGGTGFVGGHFIRLAAEAGCQIRALTRRPQRAMGNIEWSPGSLEDAASLERLCAGSDAVVHIAGVINAADRDGFFHGNAVGTLNLIEAAKNAGVRRFIHVSSLAAREPELSDYGWSKARSEAIVAASGLDWTAVRPPAVYGPGDREMLEIFRMARRGFVVLPPAGRLSLIAAGDLCRLLLRLVDDEGSLAQTYEPDDGRSEGWTHHEFAAAIGEAIGRPPIRTIAAPAWALRIAAALDRRWRGAAAKLTRDRVSYFCHPDWVARAECRPPLSLWRPKIGTFAGLKATADWYRAEGWLPS